MKDKTKPHLLSVDVSDLIAVQMGKHIFYNVLLQVLYKIRRGMYHEEGERGQEELSVVHARLVRFDIYALSISSKHNLESLRLDGMYSVPTVSCMRNQGRTNCNQSTTVVAHST